jgi:histone H3/H4
MADLLVVASKVKGVAKAKGMRMGADYIEALSTVVLAITEQAIKNAQAAGRKTVQSADVPSSETKP